MMMLSQFAEAGPYYLTLNAGASRLKDTCSNITTGFTCTDTAVAFGLDGGYQFNERFGMELGYVNYGTTKTSGPVLASTLEISQEKSGVKASATASFPVSSSFAFTAKLGAAFNSLNTISTVSPGPIIPKYSITSTSLAYGVGIKYNINETIALRAQYENLGKIGDDTTGIDTLTLMSVGISYSFGKSKPRASYKKSESTPVIKSLAPAQPSSLKVIIFLEQKAPEDKQKLTAAVSQACQCEAIFSRMYSSNAVVYQINLAPEESLSTFKSNLFHPDNASLGLKSLMQGL